MNAGLFFSCLAITIIVSGCKSSEPTTKCVGYDLKCARGYGLKPREIRRFLELLAEAGFKGKPVIHSGPAFIGADRYVWAEEAEEIAGREIKQRQFWLHEGNGWSVSSWTHHSLLLSARGAIHRVSVPDGMTDGEGQQLMNAFMSLKWRDQDRHAFDDLKGENPYLVPIEIVRDSESGVFEMWFAWGRGLRVKTEHGKMVAIEPVARVA